mgnify:CR=1 FL=1
MSPLHTRTMQHERERMMGEHITHTHIHTPKQGSVTHSTVSTCAPCRNPDTRLETAQGDTASVTTEMCDMAVDSTATIPQWLMFLHSMRQKGARTGEATSEARTQGKKKKKRNGKKKKNVPQPIMHKRCVQCVHLETAGVGCTKRARPNPLQPRKVGFGDAVSQTTDAVPSAKRQRNEQGGLTKLARGTTKQEHITPPTSRRHL